jgi:hypothetical protein
MGQFDADPHSRPRLSESERRAAAADRARIGRSVIAVTAIFTFVFVILFVLAKQT